MYSFSKSVFDFCVAFIFSLLLSPLFIVIAISIRIDSRGPVFYLQKRVGKNFHEFSIFKFRTMIADADKKSLLTVGVNDSRITHTGKFLRRYKLDELPQLINVLFGEMSLVGPRPEVKKYVNLYDNEQKKVLSVKPGITDFASLTYMDENEILSRYSNPEDGYIKEVMPHKLKLNLEYLAKKNFATDLKIIFKTVTKIFLKK